MSIFADPRPAGKPGGAKLDPPAILAAIGFARRGWLVVPRHAATSLGCTCRRGAHCPEPGAHPYFPGWRVGGTRNESLIRKLWGVGEVPFALGVRGDVGSPVLRVSGGPDLAPRLTPEFSVWTAAGVVPVYALPVGRPGVAA